MPVASPVVILGGSGFIGTRLASRLSELGQSFIIGDIVESKTHPDSYTSCDVREAATIQNLLVGARAIVNLAAEHRDDVRPLSRYHETNVEGARQVCQAATAAEIKTLVFTSSVAVYGSHTYPVDESGPFEPCNPYGETKLQAEGIYRAWAEEDSARSLVIIRPTVVFGEGNRGNVYNLLRQIVAGRFMMVGPGTNRKSMAYVGNVADALIFGLGLGPGTHIFNYADAPDMDMNELVGLVNSKLKRTSSFNWRIPMPLALAGGYLLDIVARLTRRTFPISTVRVKKFCENTQFISTKIDTYGFMRRYSLLEGLSAMMSHEFDF